MLIKYLKITTACLALAGAAAAADRAIVLIQGKAQLNASRGMAWTLCENGVPSRLAGADGFTVPQGRSLLITEAAFTVRGGIVRASRGAEFRLTMRVGRDTLDLAEVSGRIAAGMAATTVTRTFTPGLVVPSGAEVRGALAELEPGGGHPQVEVTLYGYLVPSSQGF